MMFESIVLVIRVVVGQVKCGRHDDRSDFAFLTSPLICAHLDAFKAYRIPANNKDFQSQL